MCDGVMEIESMLSRFQADKNEVITLIHEVFEDRVFRSALDFTSALKFTAIEEAQDMAGEFWRWFVEGEIVKKYDVTRQSFQAWFTVVLRNKLIDWVRPNPNPYPKVSIGDEDEAYKVADPNGRDPLKILLNAERKKEIQAALDKLSPRQRDIFSRKQNGDSVKQIATDLTLKTDTVKSHLKAARRNLRKMLKHVYDELNNNQLTNQSCCHRRCGDGRCHSERR